MKMFRDKKGYGMGDLVPLGLTFVTAAIALAFGAKVLADINEDLTGATESAIVANGSESLNTLGKWLPTLALIAVAAIILGVVVSAFYYKR